MQVNMMNSVTGLGAERVECSPENPWGVHPAMVENACPRCGWTARETVVAGQDQVVELGQSERA
jgi:hypothetical protein